MKATAYDSLGKVIKCDECDKQAGYFMNLTPSYSVSFCVDHAPVDQEEATFVYLDPSDTKEWDGPSILQNVTIIKVPRDEELI